MTKKATFLIATLAAAALMGGCSFQKQAAEPISYHGTGDIVEYHPNGKVKRKIEYQDGELVSVMSFYASGTEKSNEHYAMGELHDATYFFADGRVKTRISPR